MANKTHPPIEKDYKHLTRTPRNGEVNDILRADAEALPERLPPVSEHTGYLLCGKPPGVRQALSNASAGQNRTLWSERNTGLRGVGV